VWSIVRRFVCTSFDVQKDDSYDDWRRRRSVGLYLCLKSLLGPFYGAIAVPSVTRVVVVVVVDIDFTLPFTRCRYCRTPPAL